MEIKSASMLVTKNGYCIKIMMIEGAPIVFFVDKEISHRTWKATENNPDLLINEKEFWRMRREWKLHEISLNDDQLEKAIEIAEEICKDPYYGYPETWRRKNKVTLYDLERRKGENLSVRYVDDSGPAATLGTISALSALRQKLG